jgi:hypothetical protein
MSWTDMAQVPAARRHLHDADDEQQHGLSHPTDDPRMRRLQQQAGDLLGVWCALRPPAVSRQTASYTALSLVPACPPPPSPGCVGKLTVGGGWIAWLRHDMVERFLLHYFAMSAHTCEHSASTQPAAALWCRRNLTSPTHEQRTCMRGGGADTRGSWTTPEAAHPDRDVGSTDYVAAGVVTAPTCAGALVLSVSPRSGT